MSDNCNPLAHSAWTHKRITKVMTATPFDDFARSSTPAFQRISTLDHSIYGYEALMRFNGCLHQSPAQKMIEWERTGLITVADLFMMQNVARHTHELPTDTNIFVNASMVTVKNFTSDLLCALEGFADHLQVVVELTETAPILTSADIALFCKQLHSVGAHLALDDIHPSNFLTPASVLNAIRPNYVKLDGPHFLNAIKTGNLDEFRTLVDKSHAIGALVVAEFIESEKSYDAAISIGCDLLQGFYLGKPSFSFTPPLPGLDISRRRPSTGSAQRRN